MIDEFTIDSIIIDIENNDGFGWKPTRCHECGNEIEKLPQYWGDDPLCYECYENYMIGER